MNTNMLLFFFHKDINETDHSVISLLYSRLIKNVFSW